MHVYWKFDTRSGKNKTSYINAACSLYRPEADVVVGELSLSVASDLQNTDEFGIQGTRGILPDIPTTSLRRFRSTRGAAAGSFGIRSATGLISSTIGDGAIRLLWKPVLSRRMHRSLLATHTKRHRHRPYKHGPHRTTKGAQR